MAVSNSHPKTPSHNPSSNNNLYSGGPADLYDFDLLSTITKPAAQLVAVFDGWEFVLMVSGDFCAREARLSAPHSLERGRARLQAQVRALPDSYAWRIPRNRRSDVAEYGPLLKPRSIN